jgi:hypothetical protein
MLCTIYGLKQSAMEWYEQVRAVMLELGFTCCAVDHAVFIYDKGANSNCIYCIVGWHINDGMGTSNSKSCLTYVKGCIAQHFSIKDLGPITRFLGIQFERDRTTCQLWMHQGEYILYLLGEYDLLDCNPMHLPLDAYHPFGLESDTYKDIPKCFLASLFLFISLSFFQLHLMLFGLAVSSSFSQLRLMPSGLAVSVYFLVILPAPSYTFWPRCFLVILPAPSYAFWPRCFFYFLVILSAPSYAFSRCFLIILPAPSYAFWPCCFLVILPAPSYAF